MASDQMRRENVQSDDVERDKVPKMATHFESLAEKAKEGLSLRPQGDRPIEHVEEAHVITAPQPSQAPTGQRVVASSMPTAGGGGGGQETKHHRADMESEEAQKKGPSLEEITDLRQAAQQKSFDAVNAARERYEKAKGSAAQGGAAVKDTTVEKGRQAKDMAAQKAAEAKDVISSKAGTVKDATVEGGKGAAGYAVDVAGKVKDRAVVAGWGATHYTLEKVAEATKAVAGATSTVAGYTGEKGGAVKEMVVEKIAAAKDAVVGMEEKGAEMAARKKAEAEKGLEEKHLEEKVEIGQRGGGEQYKVHHGQETEQTEQEQNRAQMGEEMGGEQSGGVLQAIGETIMEIGQTTKDMLVGQHPKEEGDDHTTTTKE